MASATRPLGTQRAGHLPISTNNPRPGAPPKARAFLPAQEGPACLPSRAPRRCPPRRPAPATAQPPGDAPETRRRRTPRHPGARSRTCQSPAIRGPGVGGRAARTPPRAPLRVRRRPRAHRVPRRPRAQSPRERRVRTRASESGLRRARRRGCPPRPGPSEEAAPSAPRRSPHLSPEPTRASAARGAAPRSAPHSRDTKAAPRPGKPASPAARGAAGLREPSDPRSGARVTAQASRCRPAPPPPPPCPPARRRLFPAVRSLHPTWGLEQPAPRRASASTPPAGACGDCAAPGSLEARARPSGNGARRLGESPRRPRPRAPPRAAPA